MRGRVGKRESGVGADGLCATGAADGIARLADEEASDWRCGGETTAEAGSGGAETPWVELPVNIQGRQINDRKMRQTGGRPCG